MIDTITTRISARMTGETYEADVMAELSQTVLDRLCLRLGVTESTFPKLFYSVCVDASVKAYRRRYYEGISHETVSSISDSFVADILAEYEPEIAEFLASGTDEAAESTARTVVRFLG